MIGTWEEAFRLLFALAVVAGAARSGGALARRLGQPAVVGEIAAGIALGPSLLGAVAPGALALLFPAAVHSQLDLLAQAGIVLFMFSVGAQLDLTILRGQGRAMLALTNANVVAPLALGTGAALLLHAQLGSAGIPLVPFALFVGVSLSVTAFPVLARIVEDAGLSRRRVGATALACAGFTDAAAWSLLLVVAALAGASGLGSAVSRVAVAVMLVVTTLLAVRPALRRIGDRRLRDPRWETLVGVALAFVFATITHRLGVHAVLGAVLAGVVTPRRSPRRDAVWTSVDAVNRAVLLPVFFASIGLTIDLTAAVAEPGLVAAGTVMLVLAVVGKVGPTSLVGRMSGMDAREALGLGFLMNTKGITEIVVLKTGLDLGIISRGTSTVLVVVALLTTALALPALRLLGLVAEVAPRRPLRHGGVAALRAGWRLVGAGATASAAAGAHGMLFAEWR